MPVKQISDTETEGKCYYSGNSKTLIVSIPKRFAFNADLKGGDTIRIKYDIKNKTLTIIKHKDGKKPKNDKMYEEMYQQIFQQSD